MIITIGGYPGSGKSTVAKIVAKELGYGYYSTGDLRGEIAMNNGMTIDELNEIGKTQAWPHKECDDLTVKLGKNKDNIIVDSWAAWHFIPHSLKFYLSVNPTVAAQRIFANQRPDEKKQDTIEGVHSMITNRHSVMRESLMHHYNIDIADMKNYDYVIDASKLSQKDVALEILKIVKKYLSS